MVLRMFLTRRVLAFGATLLFLSMTASVGYAQRGRGQAGPPPTPKASAPIDLTGTWVPLITEDWRVRMVTPKKGDYESVPISAAGRRAADAWDPAKDEAAGAQCKAYGVAAVMRLPGRIRISWENDTTLKIEAEQGTQTRRLLFIPAAQQPPAQPPSLQGTSVAAWETTGGGGGGGAEGVARNQGVFGNLKVVTRNVLPGYLRKNGVPYSENAVVTEWYDRISSPAADLLVLNTEVADPLNLAQPFITSTHFKKLPDNAAFNPEACTAR